MFSFTSVLPSEGDENTDQVETYTHAHGSKENKTMQGLPEIRFAGWACKSAEGQMVSVCLAVRGKVDDGQRRWGRGRGVWEQKAGREPPLCRDYSRERLHSAEFTVGKLHWAEFTVGKLHSAEIRGRETRLSLLLIAAHNPADKVITFEQAL